MNPIQKPTTKLGYGCSRLMGGISEKQSLRLVDCAYSNGIRHFDVARSYGYGYAESILGKSLHGRRSTATVTTKVGFLPPAQSVAFSGIRRVARLLTTALPVLKPLIRRSAGKLTTRPKLTATFVKASVETSLRELNTDYIDYLLLHECTADELTNEILDVLLQLVSYGKIRYFGIGCDIEKSAQILEIRTTFTKLVQIENNLLLRTTKRFDLNNVELVVTHGAVKDLPDRIHSRVKSDVLLAQSWSKTLGFDVRNRNELAQVLVKYALLANHDGVVLFSARHEANIEKNTLLLTERCLDANQVIGLERLAAQTLTHS